MLQSPALPFQGANGELVAQVIEAKLGADSVGCITGVGETFVRLGMAVLKQPHAQAEQLKDRPCKLRVAFGQVGIDGRHMRSKPVEGKRKRREEGDQGLALA